MKAAVTLTDSGPRLARRNEAPNQILDCDNPAKPFPSVQNCRQAKPSCAELLYDPISGLIFSGGYNPAEITD